MTKTAKKDPAPPAAAPRKVESDSTSSVETPSNLTDIGQCLSLPLAPPGAVWWMPTFAPNSIQRFKDTDRTTMVVVAVDGALHKIPA